MSRKLKEKIRNTVLKGGLIITLYFIDTYPKDNDYVREKLDNIFILLKFSCRINMVPTHAVLKSNLYEITLTCISYLCFGHLRNVGGSI